MGTKKKLTKHQQDLVKKYGAFRKRQARQREKFAEIREEIEAAYAKFLAASSELSEFKLRREMERLATINQRALKKARSS